VYAREHTRTHHRVAAAAAAAGGGDAEGDESGCSQASCTADVARHMSNRVSPIPVFDPTDRVKKINFFGCSSSNEPVFNYVLNIS
jgi:hypothetical protein